MTPEQMLKKTTDYASNLNKALRSHVAVGLPVEKVGGQIYGDGMSVIAIGAIHEYGLGNNPRRSFLRVPFTTKKDELSKAIAKQFDDVLDNGKPADKALGLIGLQAAQISQESFITKGFGKWADLKQATKNAKGSSQVLIDTGTLRNSITYVVRS